MNDHTASNITHTNPLAKIIHIDMDCFYAAVELLERPDLVGTPVAVGHEQPRSIVTTCNYEARTFGIHSAMSCIHARRLCAQLTFLPPNFEKYRAMSKKIRDIMHTYTDIIEPLSLDEAYLDVSECHLFGNSATHIARSLKEEIFQMTGLTASAGVSVNKFLAKIGSDWQKPSGLTVIPPSAIDTFIYPVPITKIPGVGKVTATKLRALGIATCGDLRKYSAEELIAHFGKFGTVLAERAFGRDRSVVKPHRTRKSLSVERTYSQDLRTHDQCHRAIKELLHDLHRRLTALSSSESTRGIFIKIKYADFTVVTKNARNVAHVLEEFISLYHAIMRDTASISIRLLGIGVLCGHDTNKASPLHLSAPRDSVQLPLLSVHDT